MIIQTLITSCGINAVGLVNSIILSRWLGPAGRGDIAAAMLWPGLLVYLCSMGLIVATVYFSALPQSEPRLVLSNAVVLGVLFSALAVVIGFIALPLLLRSQTAGVIAGSRMYLTVVPVALITQFGMSVLQGRFRIAEVNWVRIIIPVGYLIGTVSFVALGRLSLMSILILHISLSTTSLVCTFVLLARAGIYPAPKIDTALSRQMLSYGGRVHVGQVSGFANVSLDQMLIAALLPSSALGLYVVAVSAAGLSQIFSQAVQTVATPGITQRRSETEKGLFIEHLFRQYWLVSIVIMVALAASLPLLIPSVFGARFKPAVWPAEILLVGACFMGAKQVLAGAAHGLGDPWLSSKANLVALTVTVVLLALLLPTMGIMGAAISSAAAYFAELSIVVHGLRRHHLISPRELFRPRLSDTRSLTGSVLQLRRSRLDYTPN